MTPVYGPLWPARLAPDYYPPQDQVFYRFLVSGARARDGKTLDLDIVVKLMDAKGKVLFLKRTPCSGQTPFPDRPLWHIAHLPLNEPLPPGEYTVGVEMNDNVASTSAAFERKITVKAPELAVQSVQFFHDAEGKFPAPARTQVGQTLYLRTVNIGFQAKDGKVEVTQKCEVLDTETGNEVKVSEGSGTVRADNSTPLSTVTFNGCTGPLLNAGHYLIRFTTTDAATNKTVHLEIPFHVMDP